MKEFTTLFGDILPTSLNVIVHQDRNVQSQSLRRHSRRGVVNLWQKSETALLQVVEILALVCQVSGLCHFAFTTWWDTASQFAALVFRCDKNTCKIELATHQYQRLFNERPILRMPTPSYAIIPHIAVRSRICKVVFPWHGIISEWIVRKIEVRLRHKERFHVRRKAFLWLSHHMQECREHFTILSLLRVFAQWIIIHAADTNEEDLILVFLIQLLLVLTHVRTH
mmetsp:Transcript_22257/g.34590  ORF Transcript_22257/g.34590 Transcript_22257/m.34590 type:complete len:225 (-) Transcript_22257:32-706(-)